MCNPIIKSVAKKKKKISSKVQCFVVGLSLKATKRYPSNKETIFATFELMCKTLAPVVIGKLKKKNLSSLVRYVKASQFNRN